MTIYDRVFKNEPNQLFFLPVYIAFPTRGGVYLPSS